MSINRRLAARGTARPMRVAYLVDLDACPEDLLDGVFDEAYSRWGGRRTLIVPSTVDGIDARYRQWLKLFDADIIYSFVKLNEKAVQSIHELFGPARLAYHDVHKFSNPNYRPELPFSGLSSLSVIPALLEQSWGPLGKIIDLRILEKFWDQGESRVLRENFGFLSASFRSSAISEAAPEYFKCVTLITQASLDTGYYRKDPHAEYVIDELAVLEAMSKPNPLMTLSELSDTFCPFLQTNFSGDNPSLQLVVGGSASDRILFWNGRHRSGERVGRELSSLRLALRDCSNEALISAIKKLIERRGRSHNGHHNVIIRSTSVDTEILSQFADKLRGNDGWLSVRIAPNQSHSACIPKFQDEEHVGFVYGYRPAPQRITSTSEFFGNRLHIPEATPWHISEARPPASIRTGRWMIDLDIERFVNHSRYSNVLHDWVLPRRLRLQRAFQLKRDEAAYEHGTNFIRVNRFGYPSVAAILDGEIGSISIPEDVNAFKVGLCNDFEWESFDREKKGSVGFNRFRYAEPSDKGRYLLAVLNHFESVPMAFEFLMNSFWRDIFIHLGAVSPEKSDSLRGELIQTLKKRFKLKQNELVVSEDDHWDKLARIAIQFGHKVQKEQRFVHYGYLKSRWSSLVDKQLGVSSDLSGDDQSYYRNEARLDRSIQHLCDSQLLFQGREWQCRKCYNRNWVSIDAITRTLVCDICRNERSAPVSGDWAFRLNDFVLEAYRDHGVEPVVWSLWKLSERSSTSFYFAPSMSLWDDYPERAKGPTAEIDALAVVDGALYLIEAKASARLSVNQMNDLLNVCERVRPDVLLIALMEARPAVGLDRRLDDLKEKLLPLTKLEVLLFDPADLDDGAMLPH